MIKIVLLAIATILIIGGYSYAQSNSIRLARSVAMNGVVACATQNPVPEAEKKKKQNSGQKTCPKRTQPSPPPSPNPAPTPKPTGTGR